MDESPLAEDIHSMCLSSHWPSTFSLSSTWLLDLRATQLPCSQTQAYATRSLGLLTQIFARSWSHTPDATLPSIAGLDLLVPPVVNSQTTSVSPDSQPMQYVTPKLPSYSLASPVWRLLVITHQHIHSHSTDTLGLSSYWHHKHTSPYDPWSAPHSGI